MTISPPVPVGRPVVCLLFLLAVLGAGVPVAAAGNAQPVAAETAPTPAVDPTGGDAGTAPTVDTVDTDRDGLGDGVERDRYGTNPNASDTDGDGLGDGAEVNRYGTNPTVADTDRDGVSDGTEVHEGTDPLHSGTTRAASSAGASGTEPTGGTAPWADVPVAWVGVLSVVVVVALALLTRRAVRWYRHWSSPVVVRLN